MQEIKQLFLSVVGAALTAGVIAFFQYLGAHIGEVFSLGAMVGGARTALLFKGYNA